MSTTPNSSSTTNIQYQQLTPKQDLEGIFSKESIQQLFQQTFTDSENEQEGQTVGQLAYDLMDQTPQEDLFVFVATATDAESQSDLAGCIMLSRLTFPKQANTTISFLLSPVAVRTCFQKRGIGQGLLRFAIDEFKTRKVDLIMTYGNPNYYSKVGFQQVTTDQIPAPFPLSMPHGWLALLLHQTEIVSISGRSCCVAAMSKKELW